MSTSIFFALTGNCSLRKLDEILILKFNKNSFSSNLNIIFFPIISELLLKKGNNKSG